jgi:hypothetical protein
VQSHFGHPDQTKGGQETETKGLEKAGFPIDFVDPAKRPLLALLEHP